VTPFNSFALNFMANALWQVAFNQPAMNNETLKRQK
jgi:hypothetical protein